MNIPSHTCEFANQAFAGTNAGNHTTTCHALEHVLAIPSYQMSIIDNVLLTFLHLHTTSACSRTHPAKVLTSFLMIAPQLEIHIIPIPLILYTNKPSPENIALLIP